MLKLIFTLFPSKTLKFGCFKKSCHATEVLCKHTAVFTSVGQTLEVEYLMGVENISNMQEFPVDIHEIVFKFIHKHAKRTVNIDLQSIFNISLHCIWERVVVYCAEGLVWAKQSVCTRKRLNDVHILHHFIYIKGVYPF